MESTLANQAVRAALAQNWKEAIKLNQELLNQDVEDVVTLNRLAFAHLKSGNITTAKSVYKKVLKIDKYNPIAIKNLKWLDQLTKHDFHTDQSASPSPTIFLEEPGKTKIVGLVHLAPAKALCNLMTAQAVTLNHKKHTIEIRDTKGTYIGALPDDIAHRLRTLAKAGNTYDVYIKNVQKNTVVVFIRELKRSKKFADLPSFTLNSMIHTNHQVSSSSSPNPEEGE
ncbi:MAG: hypothetical protein AAB874_03660 [Patescibacteria group bacterium]